MGIRAWSNIISLICVKGVDTIRINPSAGPVTIESVEVDGADVTTESRFGSKTVAADVVPIEIPLNTPLVRGRPVRVVVTTTAGARTGHD